MPRSTYWLHILAYFGLGLLTAFMDNILGPTAAEPAYFYATIALLSLGFLTGLAASVKRAHDRGYSGRFVLVALLPLVGPIWLLADLGFFRGTMGPNKYGPDPADSEPFVGA